FTLGQKRRQLKRACMVELFLGFGLKRDFSGGVFLSFVRQPLYLRVNVLELFFKGLFWTAIGEENLPLIAGDFIYPVTEGFLVGFLLLLWSLFGFAFHDQRSQV